MVEPYGNPAPKNTYRLHPGYDPTAGGSQQWGYPRSGPQAGGAGDFNFNLQGIQRLQTEIQGVIDKFSQLDAHISSVVSNLGKMGQQRVGAAGPSGPSNLTAAGFSAVGLAAAGEVTAGYAGYLNQRMGAIQGGGIPIQQMAMQAGAFTGLNTTATVSYFTQRRNLGMADLGQALAMQQANPILATMQPGMRGYGRYQGFLNAMTNLNPVGGAQWAQNFANTLTSPQASWFWQIRNPRGGLFNASTGGINQPQDVFSSLVSAIMGGQRVTPQGARRLANSPRFGAQLSNLAMQGIPLDPSQQFALRQYMSTGMNWNKTQDILKNSVAFSQMTRQTANTGTAMDVFQKTASLQNNINNLTADLSKAVRLVPPSLMTMGFAAAFVTKQLMGAATQILGVATMLRAASGLRGLPGMPGGLPGTGGAGGFPGMGPGGVIPTVPGGAESDAGAFLGTQMVSKLAGGLSRIPGVSTSRAAGFGVGLNDILGKGMLGKMFGGAGLGKFGMAKGIGVGILGSLLGGAATGYANRHQWTGAGAEGMTMLGGAFSGAGTGFAAGGPIGALIGAAAGIPVAELQRHLFSHWAQEGGITGAIGQGASMLTGLLGFGDPPTGSTTTSGMQPNLAQGITAMQRVNPNIRINSGFRSRGQQAALYSMKRGQGVARPGQSPHQLGKAADIGPPSQYGWIARNAGLFGLGTAAGEPWHVQAMGDPVSSPVGAGLTQGRTDQGVDWRGKGPVYAVGAGTIVNLTNSGWNMGGAGNLGAFIVLKLDKPPDQTHTMVYYAEDIQPTVKQGQHVNAGQQIGIATGGPSGIEIGWANPNAMGAPLQYGEGATAQGQNFLKYITGAATSTGGDTGGTSSADSSSGSTSGGSGGTAPKVIGGAGGLNSSFITGLSSFMPFTGGGLPASSQSLPSSGSSAAPSGNAGAAATAANGTVIPTTGTLTPAQVMAAWIKGGGPPNVAKTMAGIAMAESGDRPGAIQPGEPYKSTGWGLWQITPGNSYPNIGVDKALLDPVTNARAAVAKYQGMGNTLRPWTGDHYLTANNINPMSSGVGDPAGALFTAQGGFVGTNPARGIPVGGTGGGRAVNVSIGPIYVQGTQSDANNIASMVAAAIRRNSDIAAVGMS